MDQMFKIFEVVMNLSVAKTQTVSKQLMTTVRKLIIFVIISLGAMTLFCVGISMVIKELAIEINNPILVGSLMAFLSLSIFFFCLSQKAWIKAASLNNETQKSGPSPVEQALALLITDIVQERQLKRIAPQSTEGKNS